jgi:hypothetical protein
MEGARITRKIGPNTKDKGDEVIRDVSEGTWEAATINKNKYVYCWIFQSLCKIYVWIGRNMHFVGLSLQNSNRICKSSIISLSTIWLCASPQSMVFGAENWIGVLKHSILYPFIVLSKQTVSFCSKKLQRKALWKGPELQGKLVQTPRTKGIYDK